MFCPKMYIYMEIWWWWCWRWRWWRQWWLWWWWSPPIFGSQSNLRMQTSCMPRTRAPYPTLQCMRRADTINYNGSEVVEMGRLLNLYKWHEQSLLFTCNNYSGIRRILFCFSFLLNICHRLLLCNRVTSFWLVREFPCVFIMLHLWFSAALPFIIVLSSQKFGVEKQNSFTRQIDRWRYFLQKTVKWTGKHFSWWTDIKEDMTHLLGYHIQVDRKIDRATTKRMYNHYYFCEAAGAISSFSHCGSPVYQKSAVMIAAQKRHSWPLQLQPLNHVSHSSELRLRTLATLRSVPRESPI